MGGCLHDPTLAPVSFVQAQSTRTKPTRPAEDSRIARLSFPLSRTQFSWLSHSTVKRTDEEKLGHDSPHFSTSEPEFHPTTRQYPSGTYRSVLRCLCTSEPVRAESPGTAPTHYLRSPPHLRPIPSR